MKLACEAVVPGLNCDFVAEGPTADDVHAAMMAHGGAKHSDLMAGLSPAQMQEQGQQMAAQIHTLIAAHNA